MQSETESNRVLFKRTLELQSKLDDLYQRGISNGTLYARNDTTNQPGMFNWRVDGSNLLIRLPSGSKSNQVQVNTLIQDGKFYFEANKYSEAEARFKEALKLDPMNLAAAQYIVLIRNQRDANAIYQVDEEWKAEQRARLATSQSNPFNRTNLVYTGKGRQVIFDKLNRIRIDKVNYADLPLKDVLDDLMKITKEPRPGRERHQFLL